MCKLRLFLISSAFSKAFASAAKWSGLLTVIIVLITSGSLVAQQRHTRNYNIEDGLPSIEVYDILQDSKGYMWFATDAGVSRFDGYSFKNFNFSHGLPDLTVFVIYEDHRHRIWFLPQSGRLAYYQNDSIYSLPQNKEIPGKIGIHAIASLHVSADDKLWLGSTDGNILMIDLKVKNAPVITHYQGTGGLFLKEFRDGSMLTGGYIPILTYMRPDTTLEILLETPPVDDIGHKVGVIPYTDTSYLIHHGPYLFEVGRRGTSKTYIYTEKPDLKVYYQFTSVFQDKQKNLWLGTYNKGVLFFPKGDLTAAPRIFFPNVTVSDVYLDNEGGYWVSTVGEGVYYICDMDVVNLPSAPVVGMTLSGNRVFVGSLDGRVKLIDVSGEKPLKELTTTTVYLRQLFTDTDGSVWIIGATGIHHVDQDLRELHFFGRHTIRHMVPFGEDKFLTSTGVGKLLIFDPQHPLREDALPGFLVQANFLFYDHQKLLWITTQRGLWTYDGRNFNEVSKNNPGLQKKFSAIIEPSPGELWFSTRSEGIVIYNTKKGSVEKITDKEGLADNICNSVYLDHEGIVWAATNKGLCMIKHPRSKKRELYNITTKHGLISNAVKCVVRAGDRLFVGTHRGISILNIDHVRRAIPGPPVYFKSITVNGKPRSVGEKLQLRHFENFLNVEFVGLSYRSAEQVNYKWKMEGLDTAWHYTDQNSLQLAALPPGEYRLSVYAANEHNTWSPRPAVLDIFIEKPYWKTTWFRSLLFAILLLAISLVFMLRSRYLQRLQKEETAKVEMELKMLRSQMNPHFIFNALASIQHFILAKDTPEANKYLGKFSRLIRNVLSHSRYEMIRLSEEIQTLQLYIDLEMLRVKHKFEYLIHVDPRLNPDCVEIPSMMIQPFVENAIWHGLTRKTSEGKLEITIVPNKTGRVLEVTVEDNGIGRNASAHEKQDKLHHSLGTTLTRERLESLSNKYGVQLKMEITDLFTATGASCGTRVLIEFPLILHESLI